MINLGKLFVACGVGGQVEQLVAEDARLTGSGGGLSPEALDLWPHRPDMPPERLPVRPVIPAEVGPRTGKASRCDMLFDEHGLSLSGISHAEEQGVRGTEPLLMIAAAQGTDQEAVVSFVR